MWKPDVGQGRKGSIARRLFVGAILWSVVVLVGGALLLSAVFRAQSLRLIEEELDGTLVQLTRALVSVEVEEGGEMIRDGRVATNDPLLPSDPRFAIQLSGRYWAILAIEDDGQPGRDIRSDSLWDGEVPVDAKLLDKVIADPGQTYFSNATGPADEPLRVAMTAVRYENRPMPIVLVAGIDRSRADANARNFLYLLIGAMTVLAGGVLGAMALQVRFGLQPLRRIEKDIADVRAGRREKLDEDYPVEVQPLTGELNKLLDHNRDVVSRAQTHVGNLAHALKTPIAVLMNEAKGDTPLEQLVRRQAEAMSGNVQHYLKRARAAARAEILGARTELAPVADNLARLLMRLFADKGVEIVTEVPDDAIFRGEKQDLEELMGNLMENACKWARSAVRVTGAVSQGALAITVEDDGPGLTPEQRTIALKRGVRLDEMAPGSGLGLSIVTELVELHHGTLELGESDLGGLKVEMRFPAS